MYINALIARFTDGYVFATHHIVTILPIGRYFYCSSQYLGNVVPTYLYLYPLGR